MNRTILQGLIGMCLCLLMSCNTEVFVKDFRSDVDEAHLAGTDDALTLHFPHGGWVLRGSLSSGLSLSSPSSFSIENYDAAGKLVSRSDQIYLTDQGRAELRNGLIQLDVERIGDTELRIRVLENLLPDCELHLTLQHKEVDGMSQLIRVSLAAARYEVDQVAYTLNSWSEEERTERRVALNVIIPTDKAIPCILYPYESECRDVRFGEFLLQVEGEGYYESFSPLHLFDAAVEVEIPTPHPDRAGFEMRGDKALLTDEPQRFDLPNANQSETVVVQGPGTFIVYKQVDYRKTINSCEIHAHNCDSGKRRVFRASLEQEFPSRLSVSTQKQEAQ